ncbi:MAG: methyltransferase [Bacteroidaceae bacterium]|nr:methyltransferase [Bacteroidaceae bacterium]
MSNSYFQFKQFTIEQSDCAMKVGTDGCLLGGWFNCSESKRILDIGCGTGLIAIMAAQRCDALITGIEIDSKAALQARINADSSPWGERIEIINGDLLEYATDHSFDTIVSNPPYFVNSLKCDDTSRTLARHSDSLDCRQFFRKCAVLLTENGSVSIVIPCDIMCEWKSAAAEQGLYPTRTTLIKTTPKKAPKRVLIEFCSNTQGECNESTLILETSPGEYSDDAKRILGNFYLKL